MGTILNFWFVDDYVQVFPSIGLKYSLKIIILYALVSFLIHIHKISVISSKLIFLTPSFLHAIFSAILSQILSFFIIKASCFEVLVWLYIPLILLFWYVIYYFYTELKILQHAKILDHASIQDIFLKIISIVQCVSKHCISKF